MREIRVDWGDKGSTGEGSKLTPAKVCYHIRQWATIMSNFQSDYRMQQLLNHLYLHRHPALGKSLVAGTE